VLLRPDISPSEATKLTLIAGVAVATTIREEFGLDARIKWPNDVLIKGKKICGILTEMRTNGSEIDHVILGVGINVNFEREVLPEDIRGTSTTLKHEMGKEIDLELFFKNLLVKLDLYYIQFISGTSEDVLKKWRYLCDTLGMEVRIETSNESFQGKALDLDTSGALVLKKSSGEIQKIFAGDCIHLKVVEGDNDGYNKIDQRAHINRKYQ
jgi:BirA family biotin operon repressor/biotin-[acetyl-CoA-carboxylase] ligase